MIYQIELNHKEKILSNNHMILVLKLMKNPIEKSSVHFHDMFLNIGIDTNGKSVLKKIRFSC